MTTRLRILISTALLLAGLIWAAPPPSLDFVHISDTHVNALEGVEPQIVAALKAKANANANLRTALAALGAASPAPAFALITGDLVEGRQFEGVGGKTVAGQIQTFIGIVRGSRTPIYATLGNHDLTSYKPAAGKPAADLSGAAESRKEWARAFAPLHGGVYYSFRRDVGRTQYLFILLDNGEAESRNPGYTATQVEWLKERLASHRAGPIVVAMHLPLPSATHGRAIQEALAGVPNVALLLAGHRHSDAVETVQLSRPTTQVRTAALFLSAQNWRRIRLLEDRIEVFATGKPDERIATVALAPVAVPAGAAR
jgi:3',5'-cyclic AMP phosphodiesterase CpdA